MNRKKMSQFIHSVPGPGRMRLLISSRC